MAVSQKATSDDIAVENMLAPSRTRISSNDDSLLNQAQPPQSRNQTAIPTLVSIAQNTVAINTCTSDDSSLTRPKHCETMPLVDNQVGSNVYGQRAILSNIQNTGQLQQPVQKLNEKLTSQLRNNNPDVCVPATASGNILGASSIMQNQSNLLNPNIPFVPNQSCLLFGNLQSSEISSNNNQVQNPAIHGNCYMQHVQTERGHVQSNIDHVQINVSHVQGDSDHVQTQRGHVQSTISHMQSNRSHVPDNDKHVQSEQDHVQSILGISNISQANVTSSETLNREGSHMQSHATFVTSINESRTNLASQTNSHVNIGKSHVPSIAIFPPRNNESCENIASQTNYPVNSTNILQNDHAVHNNDSSSVNSRTENTSIGQRPFNLIDFISNSSERTCSILPTDSGTNEETTVSSLSTKTAQDGQTALLENIMGFTESYPESMTLPLTPKGSSGSGYGLGLDVDEFLNSEDGQRM